jgi:hypothetical protein
MIDEETIHEFIDVKFEDNKAIPMIKGLTLNEYLEKLPLDKSIYVDMTTYINYDKYYIEHIIYDDDETIYFTTLYHLTPIDNVIYAYCISNDTDASTSISYDDLFNKIYLADKKYYDKKYISKKNHKITLHHEISIEIERYKHSGI